MVNKAWVIANPAAGRGTSKSKLSALRGLFASRGIAQFLETRSSGDEETLAAQALEAGAPALVVVGGDGTCARVATEILRRQSRCSLAVIPVGTGNDFAKTLGVSGLSVAAAVGVATAGLAKRIDVGRVNEFFFINSCGFGFDASVLDASNRVSWLKGNAVYIYSALAQLFSYRGTSVSVDGRRAQTKLMVTVSNGGFLGGAFHIAPGASVVDGKLDVNYFDNCGVVDRVRVFAAAIRGTHQGLPSVHTEQRDRLKLGFPAPPMMEVDGELRRASSSTVTIECLPRALSVIAAPNALRQPRGAAESSSPPSRRGPQ